MPAGSVRITKREWYDLGAWANTKLWRRQGKSGSWQYFMTVD
jgi:hypothetical protein